jgi:hypothetical protein
VRKTIALFPVLLTALLVLSTGPAAASTPDKAPAGACHGSGVSVVVDLTDAGGGVLVGCAAGDPATGRQALLDAGFTVADGPTGMICTIDATPDPCPKAFTGSYWSYWSAKPGGTWAAYAVGADSSHPASGGYEGWRYNDGKAGPSVLPATLQAAARSAATSAAKTATKPAASDQGLITVASGAIIVALLAAALLVARRRRSASARDETDQ